MFSLFRGMTPAWGCTLVLSAAALAAILSTAGCRSSRNSAAAGATYTQATNVGPIPGDISMVQETVDPYLTDPVALQDGKRLFDWYNCSGCHAVHGGGGMGPSLRDATWIYGNRDDQIMDTLIHGRSQGMPAWGNKIPEDQMWKLIAYIKSMNTPLEPDPPVIPAEEQIPSGDFYPPSAPDTQPH